MANGLMAAGYAFLFFLLYRHPLRKDLPFFLIACAFATFYNVAYDTGVYLRWLASLALLVRLLPPLEACWCVIENRRTFRVSFVLMTAALCVGIINPVVLGTGYLSVRTLATVSVTLACCAVAVMNWYAPMAKSRVLSVHLVLQALWMILHSAITLSFPLLTTQLRWDICRWAYVIGATGLVIAYRRCLYESGGSGGRGVGLPGSPAGSTG